MSSPTVNAVHVPAAMGDEPTTASLVEMPKLDVEIEIEDNEPEPEFWTVDSPPTVAKFWRPDEIKTCVNAANEWLKNNPDDEDGAVFAGVIAVGKAAHLFKANGSIAPLEYFQKQAGTMVCFYVPADVAPKIAQPGGLAPADLHLTLAYLGDGQIPKIGKLVALLEDFAAQCQPIEATVGGLGKFNPRDRNTPAPFYAVVSAPALTRFQYNLVKLLEENGFPPVNEFGYTPHITLKYIQPGGRAPVRNIPSERMTFGTLSIKSGGNRVDFPMGSNAALMLKEMPDEIMKPYPNEHAARVKDPGDFDPKSFRRKTIAPGVVLIMGKPKGGGGMTAQAYRFDRTKFTPERAKAWLKRNEVEPMSFEQATPAKKEAEPAPAQAAVQPEEAKKSVVIVEKAEDKQLVWGVILRPNVADADGDIYSPEEVEAAAHRYMEKTGGTADWLHQVELDKSEAVMVESFIAPVSFTWPNSGFEVLAGDWIGAMHIINPNMWAAVKSGRISAFSINGYGRRTPVQ